MSAGFRELPLGVRERMGAPTTAEVEHLGLVANVAGVGVSRVVLPASRHVVARGFRLHYLDWGTAGKMPVVFLHGGGLTAHTWDVVCLALSDDYHCYALDQRGHGDSEWSPESDYSFDAHLRDLEAVVDHLRLTRLVLVGHSLGAFIAIRYASRHSERLAGLVVVDAGPYERQTAGRDRVFEFLLGRTDFDSLEEAVEHAHS